jgi:hypothetical protein
MSFSPQQLTKFGVPANPEISFQVFHDESGTYVPGAGDRWLLHGVLFVPEEKQSGAFAALQQTRQDTGYYEEVHYVKLRGHVTGPKAQCTTGWLRLYVGQFADFCFYHCLAVDTHSPDFQHDRFGERHHAYNRFARMTIEGAIAWSLKPYARVAFKFHSDAKSRKEGDNFAEYVPREVCRSINEKRKKRPAAYPEIRLLRPEVIFVESDPSVVMSELREECECIQIVDLITGSIGQALTGRSGQPAKIALAEIVGRWIEDTRQPPWLQSEDLHRRFSVSCFPNEQRHFYNPALATTNKDQLSFFDALEED